jgi:gluconate 2-dehydrogenase gamma chain
MRQTPKDGLVISRRSAIAGAAGAAFIPLTALTATAQALKPVLAADHRQILEAIADRLVPHDDYGPSASECGVIDYIDRSLGDFLASEKPAIEAGLAAADAFARKTYDAAFTQLPPDKKDEVLMAMENNSAAGFNPDSRTFFLRMRQLTFEGMFGDPQYGGNRSYAGWDLIRYPGPRLAVAADDQKLGVEIKPLRPKSAGTAKEESHAH